MLEILIVDDNAEKIGKVRKVLLGDERLVNENITTCTDLVTARKNLSIKEYDLLIVDLNLPERFGDDPSPNAGKAFIKEIKKSLRLKNPKNILGLTAFKSILDSSRNDFEDDLWYVILYDETSTAWSKQLNNKVDYLINSSVTNEDYNDKYDFDLAVITALHEPELRAVKNLEIEWESTHIPGDSTEYLTGKILSKDREIRVVAASAYQMGMPPASVLSMKLISHCKPKYIAMCGIAAGVKGQGDLGDILITEHSWDYNSGKLISSDDDNCYFECDPKVLTLESHLKEKFASLKSEKKFLVDIEERWIGNKPPTRLNVHIGPVVSGSAVIQSSEYINQIKKQSRKVIGLEMETYGVFFAANNSPMPKPYAFSLKSICDFADESKNDDFQAYAAYTSANYLFNFVKSEFHRLV